MSNWCLRLLNAYRQEVTLILCIISCVGIVWLTHQFGQQEPVLKRESNTQKCRNEPHHIRTVPKRPNIILYRTKGIGFRAKFMWLYVLATALQLKSELEV